MDRRDLVLKTRGARRSENELARLLLEQEKLVLKGSYGNDSSSFGLVLRKE